MLQLPWFAAAISSLAAWYLLRQMASADVSWARGMLESVANIAGVILGFGATAQSILLAISGSSPAVANLKEQQGWSYIVGHFFQSILLGLLTCVTTVVAMAFDWTKPSDTIMILFVMLSGLSIGMLVAVGLTAHYLHLLLLADQPAIRP
jgi:hypothetical protein